MIYSKSGASLAASYDVNSNALANAYDKNGNIVYLAGHPIIRPKKQLLYNLSADWTANGAKQYAELRQSFLNSPISSIPFFVSTDPHDYASGPEPHRWFHNVNDILAVNIDLGDICIDTFTPATLQTYVDRTMDVDNFIGIVGNHDCKENKGSTVPTQEAERYYFTESVKFRKEIIQTDQTANYVAYDDFRKIKYICCDWYTRIGADTSATMPYPYATTTVTDWFLDQLSSNDGYDILVLQHALFTDTYIHDDGTQQEWADAPEYIERLWTVLKDRKNKRSGRYVDSEGIAHDYDFGSCENDLIVVFNGHAHEQLHLREDGLTAFAFNKWSWVNMGYFDRVNGLMHLWGFSSSSTSQEQTFEI